MAVTRIRREISEVRQENYDAIADSDDDAFNWVVKLQGPTESPFDGCVITVGITFPEWYPFRPLGMKIKSPYLNHPNISAEGEICMDLLNAAWTPALTLRVMLITLTNLIIEPTSYDGALCPDVLRHFQTDREDYERTARQYCSRSWL
jgi:ubiquitin-protein ligase